MKKDLYPSSLQGLELNFEEAIYTVTFNLGNEIRQKGKETVFAELELTPEQMRRRVERALNLLGEKRSHALRRVFGNVDATVDSKIFTGCWTLVDCFHEACNILATESEAYYWQSSESLHCILAGEQLPWKTASVIRPGQAPEGESLRKRIADLEAEVRFYTEKCNQALEQLQILAKEIESYEQTSNATEEAIPTKPGIHWPYRSAEVLRELGLTETEQIVEFFGDFDNFVNAKDVTLLEWSVITVILRRKGLLEPAGNAVKLETSIADLDPEIRTRNCLIRADINRIDDLMPLFSAGAELGWDRLRRVRNLGRRSFEEIVYKLSALDFELTDGWCYLTDNSPVEALDFDKDSQKSLVRCQIRTVGQLRVACQEQNRFRGLRYIDKDLHKAAIAHLEKYGFQ